MIFSPGLPPYKIGGEEYYTYYQSKILQELGHDVCVVTYITKEQSSKFTTRILESVQSSISFVRYLLTCAYLLYSAIVRVRFKPDLIHAHDTYAEGVSASILGRILGVPVVVTWHGAELVEETRFSCLGNIARKLVCSWSSAIIVPSDYIKALIAEKSIASPTKIHVIPPGVDTSLFRPIKETDSIKRKYGLEKNRIVLAVARLDEIKGIDLLIQALPNLTQGFPDLKVLVVGDGPSFAALRVLSKSLEIEDRVIFTGSLDRKLLPLFYSLCDIFVLPTRGEGFGLVYLEAWACEKSIITTHYAPEIASIIKERGGGLIAKTNPADLGEKIAQLLYDRDLRITMGREGKRTVTSWYSWNSIIERNLSLYNKIL